jgi:hypothetical protein
MCGHGARFASLVAMATLAFLIAFLVVLLLLALMSRKAILRICDRRPAPQVGPVQEQEIRAIIDAIKSAADYRRRNVS